MEYMNKAAVYINWTSEDYGNEERNGGNFEENENNEENNYEEDLGHYSDLYHAYEDNDYENILSYKHTESLKNEFNNILNSVNKYWILKYDGLFPDSFEFDITPLKTAEALIPILKFLNENNISWDGYKVPFIYNDNPGFLMVTKENIIIGYINENVELEKKIIPINDKIK